MRAGEFSAAARADLQDILDYGTVSFGQAAAEAYVRRIDQAIQLISDHPEAGAVHAEVRPPIRSISGGNHRVFYDASDRRIVIRRVLHKTMDVARNR